MGGCELGSSESQDGEEEGYLVPFEWESLVRWGLRSNGAHGFRQEVRRRKRRRKRRNKPFTRLLLLLLLLWLLWLLMVVVVMVVSSSSLQLPSECSGWSSGFH